MIDDAHRDVAPQALPGSGTAVTGNDQPWHRLDAATVEEKLSTSVEQGLSLLEVAERQARHGRNEVVTEGSRSIWPLLLAQFTGPLIGILLVAAGISIVIGERLEAVAIIAIVVVNGVFGLAQEWRADRAIGELQAMFVQRARVRRDGVSVMVDAVELVPGDVVELAAGDRVPADARVVIATGLQADESTLTGESVPIWKSADSVAAATPVAERTSIVYLGTGVTAGRGICVVVSTGGDTELGDVVELTSRAERHEIPLQRSLSRLSRRLGLVAVVIAAATIAVGVLAGRPADEMFLTGVSLAVAVVPEGLPAVVTVTLAVGVGTMSRRRALLRHLEAAETLGAASVICTDKTGTLTENRMTVREVWTADGHSGVQEVESLLPGPLLSLLETAQICTSAALGQHESSVQAVGDPTEIALLVLAQDLGAPLPTARSEREVPFDPVSKMMTVVSRSDGSDRLVAHVKGAPEVVLDRCDNLLTSAGPVELTASVRAEVERAMAAMAADGLRMLALARSDMSGTDPHSELEMGLELLGVVGMHDPPRPEVPAAVAMARAAGIDVVVMTGDSPDTALTIARQVGLPVREALTGTDLDQLDDSAVLERLDGSYVLARVTPAHKMRMVRLLQGDGAVVAMTGDGVNDAPALEQASVGIAMGERGTDVARASADVVLVDDNFASIVAAIEEGRRQYANIAKFISYLLSANLGEVIAISGTVALGWPLILLPAQILWMNLVTDGVTALALGLEAAEPDVMARPPRPAGEHIITRVRLWWIGSIGVLTGVTTIIVFKVALGNGDDAAVAHAQTMAFTAMVLIETVNVLNFRSERESLRAVGLLANRWLIVALGAAVVAQIAAVYLPGLRGGLGTVGLSGVDWLVLVVVALPIVGIAEVVKAMIRIRPAG